ncbi:hypothetical protein [Coleofasciculus sp.]|uniref:hypothetical protein n=1 Tax=Coleofasciculus sp. TaxID=3100458 RepID=UPI0039F9759E
MHNFYSNYNQETTDGEWNGSYRPASLTQLHKPSPPARTYVEPELTETTTWSQLTAQQFFSEYSGADAIYDNVR